MKNNFYPKVDKTYLNKKNKTKEYFKIIINYLKKKKEKIDLIDIGCASGDFLKLIPNSKNFSLTGVDFSQKSINLAKKKVPEANFLIKDLKKKIRIKKKFDVCTCLGTLSVFDNPFKIIDKLLKITKSGGELIFFDPINENDINVLVRYQKNFLKKKQWLSAFNTFSKNYWIKMIKKNSRVKEINFSKFNMPILIKKTKKDPMRAWTFKLNYKNQIMVGTGQLLNFYIIKVKLK